MNSAPHEARSGLGRAMPPGSALVAVSLLWTLGTGVVLAVKSVRPEVAMRALPWERVQPAHTLGVMVLLIAGVGALLEVVLGTRRGALGPTRRVLLAAMSLFFMASAAAVALGRSSGLEYTTWPLMFSAVPAAFVGAVALSVWLALDDLCARSAEGAWLLLMGSVLAVLGMADRVAGAGVLEPTRSLMIEWHALDTLFAGLNTSLYGLGILIGSPPGARKPPRPRRMYALAVIALLSTFGHHHYASAQPDLLKWTAFGASMLGVVSFLRHMTMCRRDRAVDFDDSARLLRLAGLWTAFAVGSGVLFAVPNLNHLVHGTHAIVAHSMGSVIGVNVFLILAALLACMPDRRLTGAVSVAASALVLMVTDLFAAGILKGALRLEGPRSIDLRAVRAVLIPLPLIGLLLAGSLGVLAGRVLRAALRAPATPGSDVRHRSRLPASQARGRSRGRHVSPQGGMHSAPAGGSP